MFRSLLAPALLATTLLACGSSDKDPLHETPDGGHDTPDGGGAPDAGPGDGPWTDLGSLDLSAVDWKKYKVDPTSPEAISFYEISLAIDAKRVYAALGDALYVREPGHEGNWKLLKKFDFLVSGAFAVPESNTIVITPPLEADKRLPFVVSNDGGTSWFEAGAELSDSAEARDKAANFHYESGGKLYASFSGTSTALSTDLGRTWKMAIGAKEGSLCYTGITLTVPAYPNLVFKGQECPLDDAWLGAVDLTDKQQTVTKLVSMDFLGNRRPNALSATTALPDVIFAGVEGGIFKYDIKTHKPEWLLKDEAPYKQRFAGEADWYAYFSSVWVDPHDPKHLIASGFDKTQRGEQFIFFETDDGGLHFHMLTPPADPKGLTATTSAVWSGSKSIIATLDHVTGKNHLWFYDDEAN